MYINYGDKNFFEHGILVDSEHSDTVFQMLLCRPYADEEDLYQFAHVEVDIEDSWINKDEVMSFSGLDPEKPDPIRYAIACTDYYNWDNFGASSYGVYYDWKRMAKKDIKKELRGYLIACDGLDTNELF